MHLFGTATNNSRIFESLKINLQTHWFTASNWAVRHDSALACWTAISQPRNGCNTDLLSHTRNLSTKMQFKFLLKASGELFTIRNVSSFTNSVYSVRNEAWHERKVLREQHCGAIRQGSNRGLGRGQAATLRVVQRLRERNHQASHSGLWFRGGRAKFQRWDHQNSFF